MHDPEASREVNQEEQVQSGHGEASWAWSWVMTGMGKVSQKISRVWWAEGAVLDLGSGSHLCLWQ